MLIESWDVREEVELNESNLNWKETLDMKGRRN